MGRACTSGSDIMPGVTEYENQDNQKRVSKRFQACVVVESTGKALG
jgi:hypothetical protein